MKQAAGLNRLTKRPGGARDPGGLGGTRPEAGVSPNGRSIAARDRLIFALDAPNLDEARSLVDQLGDTVTFYKVGLELMMVDGFWPLVQELVGSGKKVMVDLKMYDVPETVRRSVSRLNDYGVTFGTVHGNGEIAKAAIAAAKDVKILMVTVLTSLDVADLREMGYQVGSVEELVLQKARMAVDAGCHGVIASGREAKQLREEHDDRLIIVTPGIRPLGRRMVGDEDDQKRVVAPTQAFLSGADYVVVGRPIRDARDPQQAAEGIQTEISKLFN